jgi:hypothetical protein
MPREHIDTRSEEFIRLFSAGIPQPCIQGWKGCEHPRAQITLGSNFSAARADQPVEQAVLFDTLDFSQPLHQHAGGENATGGLGIQLDEGIEA